MTAPLSAQSAIEILESEWHTGDSVQALVVLRRVVKDYEKMRAENERLREENERLAMVGDDVIALYREEKARAEKVEAALEKVCARNKLMDETFGSLLEKNINLEEQLAKQAPLVEAAMNKDDLGYMAWIRSLRIAALAYREGEK